MRAEKPSHLAQWSKVIEELPHTDVTGLSAAASAPPQGMEDGQAVALPTYGTLPWDVVRAYVAAAVGSSQIIDPDFYIGHQTVGLNFNSLNRIMSAIAAHGIAAAQASTATAEKASKE